MGSPPLELIFLRLIARLVAKLEPVISRSWANSRLVRADNDAVNPPEAARAGRIFSWRFLHYEPRQGFLLICLLFWSVVSFLLISRFVLCAVEVQGVSMESTLHNGDRYLVNRLALLFREPRRGDLVVIRDRLDDNLSVKRILGLPCESIHLAQGTVFINDQPLTEPYLKPGTRTWPIVFGATPLIIPEHHFFVMGDNRGNSEDSRTYGALHRSQIVGVVRP
jgi:signal peptidase I